MKTSVLISTSICQRHSSGLISCMTRQMIQFSYLRPSMRSSFENIYIEDELTSISLSVVNAFIRDGELKLN
jgi:hypothetical protein